MGKPLPATTSRKPLGDSALERLDLAFEYNVSWKDEKKAIKERTM